jgi:membrane-associated protease RseP (regulator of RpoE activity)
MVDADMQPAPLQEEDYGFTVDLLRSTIQKYFIVNDVRFDRHAYAFFVQVDERTLEPSFDDLRRELLDMGFIPTLLKERPGFVVYVIKKPDKEFKGITTNVILLILTILSTIGAGMLFVNTYEDLPFWAWETAGKGALYFAAPLMLILGLHEMGHYLAARNHRVAASLPYFIPAPPFPFIIGTFGAFISLREPIHSKRSLMDIGFAGPIAGFIVAIFVTILGFLLSAWDPHYAGADESELIILGTPLIFDALAYLVPTPEDVLIHPTAFAGWVGFLVTFLNLLPAGQLDGGHIFRALFGNYAKYFGYATVIAMVAISWVTGYWGWVLFIGFIILFLNHPPPLNDISPLPPSRLVVGVGAMLMLAVCFVPAPFTFAELQPGIDADFEHPEVHVMPDGWVNNTLVIVNTGNTQVDAQIRLIAPTEWGIEFEDRVKFKNNITSWSQAINVPKHRDDNYTTRVNLTITPPPMSELGNRTDLVFQIKITDPQGGSKKSDTHFRVWVGWIDPRESPGATNIAIGSPEGLPVRFKNTVNDPAGNHTRFDIALDVEGDMRYTLVDASLGNMTPEDINATPPLNYVELANNGTADLVVWLYAPPGSEEANGLVVDLWVAKAGEPVSLTNIGFQVDVGMVSYAISISPQSTEWSFTQGEEKNVRFDLISDSNVGATVTITYNISDPDAFEFSETPPAFKEIAKQDKEPITVVVFAKGDVDDTSKLSIWINYGNNQGSSVMVDLVIVPG